MYFIDGECREKGREDKVGAMPTCYCLLLAMSSELSVLSKLCIMNTLLHFLLFLFCRSLKNISLGDCILGKSNVIITVGWLWWGHQRAPLYKSCLGPPNPKSTTDHFNQLCSTEGKIVPAQSMPYENRHYLNALHLIGPFRCHAYMQQVWHIA